MKVFKVDVGSKRKPQKLTPSQIAMLRRLARKHKTFMLAKTGHGQGMKVMPDGQVIELQSQPEKVPGRKPMVQEALNRERQAQGKEPIERQRSNAK